MTRCNCRSGDANWAAGINNAWLFIVNNTGSFSLHESRVLYTNHASGTRITHPGFNFTTLGGINNSGVIVGNNDVSGFILNSGVFTPVTFGGTSVKLAGINNSGPAAGSYDGGGRSHRAY